MYKTRWAAFSAVVRLMPSGRKILHFLARTISARSSTVALFKAGFALISEYRKSLNAEYRASRFIAYLVMLFRFGCQFQTA
ncbi:TPA: hypothetical protein ACFB5T_001977, partial [Neisseria gonorrhoeae]|uniref:hypothetical protein n=4 Tax=Neisseria gonorrhoeae TaxID=485 RepID=UPI001C408F88